MKVLFVCTGNTCRSPMLKFMFEHYLANNNSNIEVDSAGIMQHENPMSLETQHVLKSHGIPYDSHVSKFCDIELMESADYIFTMSVAQADFLKENYGDDYNIIPLSDIINCDVPDPYGKGLKAYEDTYRLFEKALPQILNYI